MGVDPDRHFAAITRRNVLAALEPSGKRLSAVLIVVAGDGDVSFRIAGAVFPVRKLGHPSARRGDADARRAAACSLNGYSGRPASRWASRNGAADTDPR